MAFRKRNVVLRLASDPESSETASEPPLPQGALPGVRPSLSSSASVTSTGTAELDGLLGGHGGLALGSSFMIGEYGTTDYAGALLRAYVAQGLLHGHDVHLVGVGKGWTQNLPGLASESSSRASRGSGEDTSEKMKIAWRYEKLGRAGEKVTPSRQASSAEDILKQPEPEAKAPFCHTFDLTRRFELSPTHKIKYLALGSTDDPFGNVIANIASHLASTSPISVHRIVIPLVLSPAIYPSTACQPENMLRFVHALRALLRQYSTRVTAMLSAPLSIFTHVFILQRALESLCDGVIELVPFPYIAGQAAPDATKDTAQGMLQVLKLPLTTERGEGGAGVGNTIGDDLAFTLSRKRFIIEPFSLPPVEGDQEAQAEAGKITAKDVEF